MNKTMRSLLFILLFLSAAAISIEALFEGDLVKYTLFCVGVAGLVGAFTVAINIGGVGTCR